jgi:hypothetical protein
MLKHTVAANCIECTAGEFQCGYITPAVFYLVAQSETCRSFVGCCNHLWIMINADNANLFAQLIRQGRGIQTRPTTSIEHKFSRLDSEQFIRTLFDRFDFLPRP